MPTYDEISQEILDEWRQYLEDLSSHFIKTGDKYVLKLFIINLYEYLVVKTAYVNHIENDSSNLRYYGGLNIIKKYLNQSNLCTLQLRALMSCANDLRHCAYKKDLELDFLLGLITDHSKYQIIWDALLKDCPLTYKFLSNGKKLSVIYHELKGSQSLRRRCTRYVKDCFAPQQDGNSRYSVGEVVSKIVSSYGVSENYAINIVIGVISEQIVSE